MESDVLMAHNCVQVFRLPKDVLVEIDCIALTGSFVKNLEQHF